MKKERSQMIEVTGSSVTASRNRDYTSGALHLIRYFRKGFVNLIIRRCQGLSHMFSIYRGIQ